MRRLWAVFLFTVDAAFVIATLPFSLLWRRLSPKKGHRGYAELAFGRLEGKIVRDKNV
jgi:hypothetical protein